MISNPYIRTYPSLYRGIVEDNKDPKSLGRCKVRVPSVHGSLSYPIDILPWARPLVLSPVSENKGSVNIPDVGDIVWVLFEGADKEFPIYFGGTYTKGLSISSDIVLLHAEGDDYISYDRVNHTYSLTIGDRQILITPDSISIKGDVTIAGNLKVSGYIDGKEEVSL